MGWVCGAQPPRRQKLPLQSPLWLPCVIGGANVTICTVHKELRGCPALASMAWGLGTVLQKRVSHINGAWLTVEGL